MNSKEARQNYILEQLKDKKEIYVNELAESLSISPVTIRKDMVALEKAGHLVRTHGGARLRYPPVHAPVSGGTPNSKQMVARKAADLVKNGEVIFLGSGTTCIEIARYLKPSHKNLTIVSNNLNVLMELAGTPSFTLMGTGGQVDHHEQFTVFCSDFVIQFLEKILVQKAFLTADGVTLKNGYTTHNRNEFHLYESIRKISEHMIFAVEGRKFNKNSVLRLTDIDSIHNIISDPSIPQEYADFYRNTGKTLYIGNEV